ncbi:hypothetical protein Barb7_03084 [Bacteroidales bacterium Barb7]|nr:hypothetical protein Barb7_03084 [Bacteroidales bacterium Barb7]
MYTKYTPCSSVRADSGTLSTSGTGEASRNTSAYAPDTIPPLLSNSKETGT